MKKTALIAVTALLCISSIHAQPKKGGWHEKMMKEKIAFITNELSLTPEEAQAFWPVYNQVAEENRTSQKAMMKAYRAMAKALEEGSASESEINRLLDEYLAALQGHKESGKDDADRYRKVLPGEKVAKLYVAEEKFRRQHIRNFKGGHKGPGGGKPGARKWSQAKR